jgi:hypothetical protein
VVAQATTTGDELVIATCDLDAGTQYKTTVFDFERYRRPELYGSIVHQPGSAPPDG